MVNPLSPEEIEAMTETVGATLSQTGTRTRKVQDGDDGQGGRNSTTATADYSCRVLPVNTRPLDGEVGEKITATADAVIIFLPTADVRATDTVTVGGQLYDVIHTDSGKATAIELVVWVRKNG